LVFFSSDAGAGLAEFTTTTATNQPTEPVTECRPTAPRESGATARPSRVAVLGLLLSWRYIPYTAIALRTRPEGFEASSHPGFGPLPGSQSRRLDHTRPLGPSCALLCSFGECSGFWHPHIGYRGVIRRLGGHHPKLVLAGRTTRQKIPPGEPPRGRTKKDARPATPRRATRPDGHRGPPTCHGAGSGSRILAATAEAETTKNFKLEKE